MFDILNITTGHDMLDYLQTSVKIHPDWTAGQHVQAWMAFEQRYQARRAEWNAILDGTKEEVCND